MSTQNLRIRLDKLLGMLDKSSDGRTKGLVAFVLDTIPSTLPEIQKDILVIDRPSIKALMGRTAPYRKDKCIRELTTYNRREDILGQICDLILRIATTDGE